MAIQIQRREFIGALGGAAAWPLAARAQQMGKLPTIGFLGRTSRSAAGEWTAAFLQRLRELGWIENRTITIEYRWAEGRNERSEAIAAEFVRLKVDIIITSGTPQVPRGKAGNISHPDCIRGARGPGWEQSRREPAATGCQRHRPVEPDDRHRWQED